jgi:hypothetical protein
MAALDVGTGETVWKSAPLVLNPSPSPQHQRLAEPVGEADPASYASPVLFTLGNRRLLVSCSSRHAFGVDADTGELLWTRPLPTRHSVIAATPVLCGDAVFVTAPDAGGGKLYHLTTRDAGLDVAEAWTTPLDTCQGGVLYLHGSLYGSWYRGRRGWACIDGQSGELRYENKETVMGPVLYADGRLYWLSQEGEMALVSLTPQGFVTEGRFRLVPGRPSDVWAHPVILNGRLYLRHHEQLWCYDVRAR